MLLGYYHHNGDTPFDSASPKFSDLSPERENIRYDTASDMFPLTGTSKLNTWVSKYNYINEEMSKTFDLMTHNMAYLVNRSSKPKEWSSCVFS